MHDEQTVRIENEQESFIEKDQSEERYSNKENPMSVEREVEP